MIVLKYLLLLISTKTCIFYRQKDHRMELSDVSSCRAGSNDPDEALDRLPTSATCMNLLKLPPYKRFVIVQPCLCSFHCVHGKLFVSTVVEWSELKLLELN